MVEARYNDRTQDPDVFFKYGSNSNISVRTFIFLYIYVYTVHHLYIPFSCCYIDLSTYNSPLPLSSRRNYSINFWISRNTPSFDTYIPLSFEGLFVLTARFWTTQTPCHSSWRGGGWCVPCLVHLSSYKPLLLPLRFVTVTGSSTRVSRNIC